jgi:hypothetical protein
VRRHRYLKPRRLVVDEELYRRRAQGVTLRELAAEYGVAHTTLGRHLARPDAKMKLRAARVALRLEKRERRESDRVAARKAAAERRAPVPIDKVETTDSPRNWADSELVCGSAGAVDVRTSAAVDPSLPRRWASDYADWLDDRDYGRALTRRELWSVNDELAAAAASGGGGIAALVEITGLRTEENVRRLIDPDVVARADANDSASATIEATNRVAPRR